MNKYIKYFIIAPIIIYLWLLAFLWFSQKWFVYFPTDTAFEICNSFQKEEQNNFKWTKFYEQKWNENLIVFFHWNAWRACDRSYIKWIFEKIWSSIIFVEYFWYSDSENNPNIKSILSDVENIWEYIKNQNEYKNISLVWRSIWTWPASYYAQNFKTDKLLLISPYSSLYKIWKNKYPIFPVKTIFTEDYRPEEYLQKYKNELLIIHWTDDKIIPIQYWIELFESIPNKNKNILKIPNTWHNNIIWKTEVDNTIIDYLK